MTTSATPPPDAGASGGLEAPPRSTLASLGRRLRERPGAVTAAAALVGIATGLRLVEPWIYAAIIDDIAGTLIEPDAAAAGASPAATGVLLHDIARSAEHLVEAVARVASVPFSADAELASRTVPEAIATLIVAAIAMVLARGIATWAANAGDNTVAVVASDVERDTIRDSVRHVLTLPLPFFLRRSPAKVARLVNLTDEVSPVVDAAVQQVWPDVVTLVVVLTILFVTDVELALVAAVAVPLYAALNWRLTRALDATADRYLGRWDAVAAHLHDVVAGVKTVRTFGMAEREVERLDEEMRAGYAEYVERNRLGNRFAWAQELVVVGTKAAILVIGGYRALEGQLTPGIVVLFLGYLDTLFEPIERLAGLQSELQQNVASVRRADRLMDVPSEAGADRPALVPGPGALTVEQLTFAYDSRPVLRSASLVMSAGEHVVLVGPSGSGKTTLADCISGLLVPQGGAVRLDGTDLSTVSPESVRRAVRGLATDAALFNATLADNVRYGAPLATDDDVRDALRRAGAADLASRLPDGLASKLGEQGTPLSAGERQRVLLARAFCSRPSVLVLDEATANLDLGTETVVRQQLAEWPGTVLTIAHRRSMIDGAARVLVLRNGRIEQDGPASELVEAPGWFRDVFWERGARAARVQAQAGA